MQHVVVTLYDSGTEADSTNTAVTLIQQSPRTHCIAAC